MSASPGSRVVYERNAKYVPRDDGTPDATAGPKIAHFDRIEWLIMPDAGTVAAAMQNGEIDWWLTPNADLLPLMQKQARLKVETVNPHRHDRHDALQPPQSAVRQSGAAPRDAGRDRAVRLHDRRRRHRREPVARQGRRSSVPTRRWRATAGMEVLTSKRDPAKVKRDIEAAGYKGEKVVVLMPSDIPWSKAAADITVDMLRKLGVNVEAATMDWATLVQRRAKTEPVGQGGWSIFHTGWSGLDMINPAGHVFLRGNGRAATVGWPSSPKIEELRDAWFKASDLAAQKALADKLQLQAFEDVPYIPLGQYFIPTAYQAKPDRDAAGQPGVLEHPAKLTG